ncbi:sodium channel protein 60E-like [Daphnia carinata]|uniref:sodium channel protein 60E-like n=1 Tax=Daphnia carinata TaxID=120202 RepID=UPI002868B886|nr:sodium channel protein 60E-like [Daphnia carinata]
MTTILLNCIFLAMTEPVEQAEYVFLGIYSCEMVIKAVAKGLVLDRLTYLRSPWNWLDFVVILSGYATLAVEIGNLAGLRTFRVLRALKTVSIIPGLRTIINALLKAMRQLLEVMTLIVFCLSVLALFALQVFMGELRNKCVRQWEPNNTDLNWHTWIREEENWLREETGSFRLCGNLTGTWHCPADHVCLPGLGNNPNFGYTNFDTFPWSMLTTFQLITLDYWENIYNMVLAVCGPYTIVFFMIVVFFGAFYLINLMLAVVAMSYDDEAGSNNQEKIKTLTDYREESTFSFDPGKLPLVLLEKGHHADQARQKKARMDARMLANRNHLSGISGMMDEDDQSPPRQHPHVADLVWALAKSEAAKLEAAKHEASCHKLDAASGDGPPLASNDPSCSSSTSPWLRLLRSMLQHVIQSPWMDFFITISIVLNTAFLAAEHHGMSPDVKHVLDVGNKVFTSVFTTECILKMGAMGTDFFRNGWNVFDFVIVLASLVDLGLEIVNGLSVLRGMRLMRVLRLAQSWTTMRVLLSIILSSLGALANLTFVLAIVVYIFAVIGMQLFGRDYTPENFYPDPVPRWNFKDFFHSFMMIFRILCGEWAEPLWDCMRAERKYGSEICFSIFLPALVMGNFLVLNLFLALLLNSFSCEELKSRKEEINEDSKLVEGLRKIRTIAKATRTLVNLNSFERSESVASKRMQLASRSPSCVALSHNRLATPNANASPARGRSAAGGAASLACSFDDSASVQLRSVYGSAEQQRAVWPSETKLEPSASQQQPLPPFVVQDRPKEANDVECQEPTEPVVEEPHHQQRSGADNIADWSILIPTVLEVVPPIEAAKLAREDTPSIVLSGQEEMPEEPPDCIPSSLHDKCCCCWQNAGCSLLATPLCRRWMAGRTALLQVVKHPAFEWSILILIFGSSITLCFEDIYLEENPRLMSILRWTNMAFAILFALEMIIKWFALGLKYYFSSVWTALDFVIVTVSVISVAVEDSANLSALRSLRTLRALRPLRAISRWQGMKIVVNALMFAIPAIFNVLLVCLVFWLVFSILGVQLFGGKFYKCIDDETGERFPPQLIDTKADCLSRNLTWTNSPIHFDHVGHAYLALFQVATFEGWMEIMADAVDVRGVDLQPSYEANLWAYLYFVVFIVCGAFFTLNLFIGVIIDNFNMLKKRYEGGVLEMFLTESQKHYYTAMKKLGRKKPRKMIRRPMNPYLALFYDIAMSRRFEIAIFIMIFLNMVVMGVEHYGQPPVFTFILELCNALFTTMFALEAVVKMIGLRHHYFTLPWNLFDLALVSCSVVGLIMEDVLNEFPISPTLLRVVRVFRLGRVLRLVKAAKGIRKLLFALIVSLPALFNIGALLALITFIYAIIGMALFGHVIHSGALNEMVNFETFGRSMLLLFRLMTGAGWNDILNPLLIQPPYCDMTYHNLPYGNCGSPMLATLYLVSFIVLSSMIVINMYIAVLLENFNQAHHEEELGLGEEDLERFYAKWSRFDPYATQFIAFGELSDFVASLDPPLGISRPNMAALVNLDILIASGDRLHCLDILHALTRRVLGDVEDTEHFRKLQEQMDEKFKKQFPNRRELEIVSSTAKWKQRDTAARVIQRAYQLFLRRKLLARKRMEEMRGHVQTQTSFSIDSSDSSFAYEPDRLSLRSVLNRMSSLFHTYLGGGGLSRQSSSRYGDSPSPIGSVASGGQASRQNSTRRRLGSGAHPPKSRPHSTLLDVLVPGSRRSSIWSLGTMVVSAQVHNECSNGQNHQMQSNGQLSTSCGNRRGSLAMAASPPDHHADGGITLRYSEVFPPQSSSSSSTTAADNGGAFLSPPQQRSDVIVKLTAASLDSDLNM